MPQKDDKFELSEVARNSGLKTKWACWRNRTIFSDIKALLEICKRIEDLEEKEMMRP